MSANNTGNCPNASLDLRHVTWDLKAVPSVTVEQKEYAVRPTMQGLRADAAKVGQIQKQGFAQQHIHQMVREVAAMQTLTAIQFRPLIRALTVSRRQLPWQLMKRLETVGVRSMAVGKFKSVESLLTRQHRQRTARPSATLTRAVQHTP
jgi:hypothetical protein